MAKMTDECERSIHIFTKGDYLDSQIIFRRHAFEQMYTRMISEEDVEIVIRTGEIIEYYPDDHLYPSALFFGDLNGRLLHVVVAFNRAYDEVIVITAYEPDENHFESGKIRRK